MNHKDIKLGIGKTVKAGKAESFNSNCNNQENSTNILTDFKIVCILNNA